MSRMNMQQKSMPIEDEGAKAGLKYASGDSSNGGLEESISPPSIQKKKNQAPQQQPKGPINVDDQVIPALNQKKKPQEYEYGDEDEGRDEAEPIAGDKMEIARPLI
jgi:hypothetical protein